MVEIVHKGDSVTQPDIYINIYLKPGFNFYLSRVRIAKDFLIKKWLYTYDK